MNLSDDIRPGRTVEVYLNARDVAVLERISREGELPEGSVMCAALRLYERICTRLTDDDRLMVSHTDGSISPMSAFLPRLVSRTPNQPEVAAE